MGVEKDGSALEPWPTCKLIQRPPPKPSDPVLGVGCIDIAPIVCITLREEQDATSGARFQTLGPLVTLRSQAHMRVEIFKPNVIVYVVLNVGSIQRLKNINKSQKIDSKGYCNGSHMGSLFFQQWNPGGDDQSRIVPQDCAGGLDSLTLSSLYDEGAYRSAQQPVYGAPAPNPFEVQDPFALSSSLPPPPTVQREAMAQQQVNPFGPYQPYQPHQQHMLMNPANPFGDAGYGALNPVSHPQNNNPFGSTGLL